MGKLFFEVFPSLKLEKNIQDIMGQTEVEKVSSTRKKDFLRVYLKSNRLISKEDIWYTEQAIKSQLFPGISMVIKFYERFELSSQYTPQNLMEVYLDSILAEIQDYSQVMYNILKNAQYEYPSETKMVINLEDTVIARSKEAELTDILQKILVERCGFSLEIYIEYREAQEGKYAKEDMLKLKQEVAQIYKRVAHTLEKEEEGGLKQPVEAEESAQVQNPKESVKELNKSENASSDSPKAGGGKPEFKKGEFAKGSFKKGGDYGRSVKRSDNPDVLYGRDFEEEAMKIEELIGEMGEVVIRGKILDFDSREIKNEKTILIFNVTDFTDTITVKMFARNDQVKEITAGVKPGAFVKIKGISMVDKFDHELTIGSIAGIKKISDFTTVRMDTAAKKRVELHCHTKMSDMDGVSEAKDIVKRAYKWGHKAIAITDHGAVQSFTDANHVWDDLWKEEKNKRKEAGDENPDKQDFFKIIYGVEAYIVDDLKQIVTNNKGQDFEEDYVVFDIETTGFSPIKNRIIEIGAVKVEKGQITERFSSFVNPQVPIPFEIEKLTGISDDMVVDAPKIEEVLSQFLEFCEGCVLVAQCKFRYELYFGKCE